MHSQHLKGRLCNLVYENVSKHLWVNLSQWFEWHGIERMLENLWQMFCGTVWVKKMISYYKSSARYISLVTIQLLVFEDNLSTRSNFLFKHLWTVEMSLFLLFIMKCVHPGVKGCTVFVCCILCSLIIPCGARNQLLTTGLRRIYIPYLI